jgi:CBS domain containing-hemolysin-like protein
LSARPALSISRFPPVRILSTGLIGLTNWIMPGKGLKKGPFVSELELLGIVEAAAEDMVIEHEERRLIESIITFGDTTVREVMTPRPDIVTVSAFDDITAALDVAIEQGYSRLPVMNEDDGDVIGVVYAKDLMKAEREGRGSVRVTELSHPVRFVPENKPVGDIMREMQADKSHMTMVADEYGEFSGVVTLEDCIEELVGDITDEFDSEEQDVERKASGDYLIEGGTSIGDVNELLSLNLPDTDWATIGGYVFGRLGHVPSLGEAVDFGGWRIAVEEMLGRRIRRVRISVLPSVDLPEDDGAREGNGNGRFGGNGGQRR